MKTKLRLLFFTILLSVSYAQAQKTDVWDFGATQLDTNLYNNLLDVTTLNGLLGASGTASTTNVVGNTTFTTNVLSWVGGSDRLRTTNTSLTRYDANVASVPDATTYRGRLYANGVPTVTSGLATSKYLSMTLAEDDEVTLITRCDALTGELSFALASNYLLQKDSAPITSVSGATTEVKFVAKTAGVYRIFDGTQKVSFFRIYRKAASYAAITGNLDVSQAPGMPGTYSVVFTNTAGKSWTAPVVGGSYTVSLPKGYTYKMSLLNANGFIISNGDYLGVSDSTTTYDIAILKVDLFTVSGNVTGLGTDISKLNLTYTPDAAANKIYVPTPVINTATSTYNVDLEANTVYTVSGSGVNDYEILANTVNVSGTTSVDVAFTPKPTYPITINTTGLDATQISNLKLTFTNINESAHVYNFNSVSGIVLRNGTYSISYTGLDNSVVVMTLTSNLKVNGAPTSKTLDFVAPAATGSIAYAPVLTVGTDKTYKTINAALSDVTRMTRTATDRVTIMIDPGNYEEMIDITQPNVTLKNASATPSIALQNKGVDIDPSAVRITSYYGHGYNYYSMKSNSKWDADVLRVNKENGSFTTANAGSGTTTYWNATLIVSANGFIADDIIIENSYNQYISKKESEDVLVLTSGNKGVRPTTVGSTAVQNKSFVERAAAIAVKNNIDKVILNKCRVIGRQDSFYGGTGARVVVYKGVMMGGTDYLFGGMNAVFYKTDLALNTSEDSNDVSYITAAQQGSGRGYLMYECTVTSATPGIESASLYRSKPGYFGRPWSENTSEVVFYNTTIQTSNNPSFDGASLIMPVGWMSTLAPGTGQSAKMYEYGTVENSGVYSTTRAGWSTKLAAATLTDGTAITTLNFTKGSDGWDPLPQLISNENLGVKDNTPTSAVNVIGYKNRIAISNVKSETAVAIYTITGAKVKTLKTTQDIDFEFQAGVWIVVIKAEDGQKAVKVITH